MAESSACGEWRLDRNGQNCVAEHIPVTHFDEIKAMSVEELANFICGIYVLKEDMHGDYDYRLVVNGNEFRDFADLLDWLKAPVEVDK